MSEIEQWVALLKDPSPRIRAASLRKLGEEGGPEAGILISPLRQDRDEMVQVVAEEMYKRWEERHPAPPPKPSPGRADPGLAALGAGVAPRVVDPRKIALEILRKSIDRLVQICHSGSPDLAKAAIEALGKIRDWSSVDSLLELLQNTHLNAEVARALSTIGDYRAVDPLIQVIDSGRWSNPKAVILALGGFRTRAATVQLIRFLQDDDPKIRSYACEALGEFTYDEDVEWSLIESLQDPAEEVVLASLLALKGLDSESSIEAICDTYRRHHNEKVKATVFASLRDCTHKLNSVLAIIEEALRDSNERVRANAVECLWNLDADPSALRTLLSKAVADPNNRVRANVAIAFGKFDPTESIGILSEMFDDPDRRVRASAVYAARFIESDRVALWLLSTLTRERSQDVLEAALEGLGEIASEGIVDQLLRFLNHANPIIREGIVKALAGRDDKRIVSALSARYPIEEEEGVSAAIVQAISKAGGDHIHFFIEATQNEFARVQAEAIQALTDLARLEVIGVLDPFLRNPNPTLKAKSALALWNLGQLDVAGRIFEMLDDPRSPSTSLEAMQVLGQIGIGLQDLKDPRLVHLVSSLKNYEEASAVEAPVAPVPSRPPTSPGLARVPKSQVQIEEMDAIMNLLSLGEQSMALELANRTVEDHSEDPLATYLLGKIHLRGSNPHQGAEAFKKSQGLTRTFFPSSLNLARLAQTSGDLAEAFDAFLEAFQRKSKLIHEQITITRQLLEEGRHEEVSAMVKELLSQMPLEGNVYLKLGIRFLKAKRFSEAFEHLRRAYAFDGENNAVRFNLALACYHMGKAKECKLLCNRVLKSSATDSPEAQRALHLLELL